MENTEEDISSNDRFDYGDERPDDDHADVSEWLYGWLDIDGFLDKKRESMEPDWAEIAEMDTDINYSRFNRGVEQKDPASQYKLGLMYFYNKDTDRAARLIALAAGQGHTDAQLLLGLMNYRGKGVVRDYDKAAKCIQKAAKQGHIKAQHNLGVLYAKGEGIKNDDVQAYAWLDIASKQGYKESNEVKERVTKRMEPHQITDAQKLSRELMESYGRDKVNSPPQRRFSTMPSGL